MSVSGNRVGPEIITEDGPVFCAWCESEILELTPNQKAARRRGLNIFCGKSCNAAFWNDGANARYFSGPCPTCGKMFRSMTQKKKFCTVRCYTESDQFRALLHTQHVTRKGCNQPRHGGPDGELDGEPGAGVEARPTDCVVCQNCEKTIIIIPGRRPRKFCDDVCRRHYMAMRFDRWVANPETLALPQCYDEFLDREELPCLIAGCHWTGKQLAYHCNIVHGIPKDELKAMAGFNLHTGLISSDLKAKMAARMREEFAEGRREQSLMVPENRGRVNRTGSSLEAQEHHRKARALISIGRSQRPAVQCRVCPNMVEQPTTGTRYYCSNRCRSVYYTQTGKAELICAYCGRPFMGGRDQVKRARHLQKVCCSNLCRNRMNMVACLAARRIEWEGPLDALSGN
jgi:endogenous inhibitor of DNA gyrase (YacG/DUF329 family)